MGIELCYMHCSNIWDSVRHQGQAAGDGIIRAQFATGINAEHDYASHALRNEPGTTRPAPTPVPTTTSGRRLR